MCARRVKFKHARGRGISSEKRTRETIMLDTGAEINIFNDEGIFKSIGDDEAIFIDGIDEDADGIYSSTSGDTDFGRAYLSKRVAATSCPSENVSTVDNLHSVDYDNRTDTFLIQPEHQGIYEFKRNIDAKKYRYQ